MTLKTEVVRGLKWTAGAKLGSQLITWGITIFVMRLLSPSDYGLMAMASVFIVLLAMFVDMGLGSALIQVAEINIENMRKAFGLLLLTNGVLWAGLSLAAPLIADFYGEPRLTLVLRVLALQYLLTPFYTMPDVLLQRRLEFRQRSLIELGSAVFGSLVTLLLALNQYGVWALVIGNLAGTVWRTVAVNGVEPFRHLPLLAWRDMRSLLSFGGNITASRLLWFCYTQADTVIVGRMLGGQVLGLYSVAMHLASLPLQRISAILNQVAFPAFARYQHDKELIGRQLKKAFSLMSLAAFPVLWGLACTAPELVPLLLGQGWEGAVLPLQILSLVMPFRTLLAFLPAITDAMGRPEAGMQNGLLGCLIMPPAYFIGCHWGIEGVAGAWGIVFPFVLLINMRRMLKVIGLHMGDMLREIARPLLCAAGMAAMVRIASPMLAGHVSAQLALVLEIVIGVVVYGVLTLMINFGAVREVQRLVFNR